MKYTYFNFQLFFDKYPYEFVHLFLSIPLFAATIPDTVNNSDNIDNNSFKNQI